jgi:teichuronic acid exporter
LGDLKSKALYSTFWSFFETIGNQGLQFAVGIILARLLLPEDYGLIGVLAIFMGIAGVLIDSGFKTSIIRSQDLTDIDCSTIFYVNFLVSIIVALLLFTFSPSIAVYFRKPELVNVTRVLALSPVLNGFGLVQSALLFKNLQFKRNAKISITSNIISGSLAIFLAFKGFSYWALVWKVIIGESIYNLLLWVTSSWRPQLVFSTGILKKHFRFSSNLLLTGMIDTFFDNIYSFIFGKFFSFKELGFFTRGKGYVDMVTKTLSSTIQKVNSPLLAGTGKDNNFKINAYSKLLHGTVLLVFPASAMLVAVAKPMIIFLIGEKWLPAVPFIQILAISGIIYPVLNSNCSLFEVLGRSDLILKSALLSRPIQIIILLVTINYSAITIAWGIVLQGLVTFYLSFYFVKKVTSQSILALIKVLLLPLLLSTLIGLIVYIIGVFLMIYYTTGIVFGIQLIMGILIMMVLFHLLKFNEIIIIKTFVFERVKGIKNKFQENINQLK